MRAVLAGITLLTCLWMLELLRAPGSRSIPQARPRSIQNTPPAPADSQLSVVLPPVDIQELPFTALDNTCLYSQIMDISGCTGMLSEAAARVYRIKVAAGGNLHVTVEPENDYFDAGFALMSDSGCVGGVDQSGPGWEESSVFSNLPDGQYRLIVSGYADNCGPYRLTVADQPESLATYRLATAQQGPNGIAVRWRTFAETNLKHFELFRLAQGERRLLATFRSHGSPAGWASYRYLDRDGHPDSRYELIAVSHSGRSEAIDIKQI